MKRIRIALTGAALLATAALTPVAAGGPQLPMAGKPKPVSPPTTRPSHPAHPAHPAKPAKPGHPAHPAKPAKRAHPAHPARPAHPAKPAHPAHPATPARPALRTHGNGSHKDAFAASKGKGHEKTQTTREGVFPFDDVEEARKVLEQRFAKVMERAR